MAKKMLIDATHAEETRVAVIEGDRLTEFDYESQFRKALKGSIFLAKVTRVEPSLQAAFVNFGGNRHGFLPFSEIHPDYFRIPISDREALLAEQEAMLEQAEKEESELEEADEAAEQGQNGGEEIELTEENARDLDEAEAEDDSDAAAEDDAEDSEEQNGAEEGEDRDSGNRRGGRNNRRGGKGRGRGRGNRARRDEKYDSPEDAERRFRFNLRRKYKIQEVIKRGQIMLVQVSKEERGNKGAAVGTYLSLPGRYCVLMPNSPRAGGVSRKIANYKDRNRMREIMKDLEVPKGMSVILRTAGMERTKTEIKRDLDYLIKLWNNIRELTLESSAPALVYEEADLIKRAVRDLYTRDVDEVHVAGEEGFKNAKNFMKMMIPSHAKKVKEYKNDDVPLFNKYRVERQIAEIGETQVTLPSGGYLVINPTEALVSIDVNSGRSTKERHIEETALKTNLEAAEEVARQLRLRDLGGLVVIDFIDMEDRRNNAKVERKMRDALSTDRARVQVGRISSFGLMELSRQRLNPSLTEAQFELCKHCEGTGRVRTADATSIMVLRAIEDEGIKARAAQVIVHVAGGVALYLLNNKRSEISALENRYDFQILIRVDDAVGASSFRVEVSKPASDQPVAQSEQDEISDDSSNNRNNNDDRDNDDKSRNSRRRGRRGGRRRNNNRSEDQQNQAEDKSAKEEPQKPEKDADSDQTEKSEKSAKPENKDEKKKPARGRKPAAKKASSTEKQEDDVKQEETAKKSPSKGRKPKSDKDAENPKAGTAAQKADEKGEPDNKDAAAKPASNDDKEIAAREYEVINQPIGEKKKGWWNRLKGE